MIHSLRHTFGTRLGDSGADAFTVMRLMGHCSVTVSQKYVHPQAETVARAIGQLENYNRQAARELSQEPGRMLPTTVFTTVQVEGLAGDS